MIDTCTTGRKCSGCEWYVKRPENEVDATKLVLRALLDIGAKWVGNKKSSGDSVARTGIWVLKTGWE